MIGGKSRSRVAVEAEEKRAKARELDRRIRELNRQIQRPNERPPRRAMPPEGGSLSPLGRFLGAWKTAESGRRQPLLIEKRRHRNRTILWALAAFVAFIWALGRPLGKLLNILR